MCMLWKNSFSDFYKDMGDRPQGKTIDRINNNMGYYKENCRWATLSEQAQNKTTSFHWFIKGIEFDSSTQAAVFYNVTKQTITRWVLGFIDRRRGNKFTEAKNDCYRLPRY